MWLVIGAGVHDSHIHTSHHRHSSSSCFAAARDWQSMVYFMVAGFAFGAAFLGGILLYRSQRLFMRKKITVYTRSVNLKHQKETFCLNGHLKSGMQSSCRPKRNSPVKQYSQAPGEVASFEPKIPGQGVETYKIHQSASKGKLSYFLHLGNQSNMH